MTPAQVRELAAELKAIYSRHQHRARRSAALLEAFATLQEAVLERENYDAECPCAICRALAAVEAIKPS